MKKVSLCIGINDYPNTLNDLNGCVNDAHDWHNLLKNTFGFSENELLLDEKATEKNILHKIESLITKLNNGDIGVITYSGHGTWVYDSDMDEPDNRDEAICAYDSIITDDQIKLLILKLHPNAKLTFILDSCHSGTATRTMISRNKKGLIEKFNTIETHVATPKYMPPLSERDSLKTMSLPTRKRFLYPENNMNEILLSGCKPTEYSYDAYLNGKYNGVFTAYAIEIIKANPDITYYQLHQELRDNLPNSRFPQSPQLEGSLINKNSLIFR